MEHDQQGKVVRTDNTVKAVRDLDQPRSHGDTRRATLISRKFIIAAIDQSPNKVGLSPTSADEVEPRLMAAGLVVELEQPSFAFVVSLCRYCVFQSASDNLNRSILPCCGFQFYSHVHVVLRGDA